MTRHDDSVRLHHMLDHACAAVRMTQGRSRADLDQDEMLRLALTRAVEVIGEACTRVSEATCQKHPEIPWKQIVGTRHRLVHGYDRVDLNVLWDTIHQDLPPLIAQLQAILGAGGR